MTKSAPVAIPVQSPLKWLGDNAKALLSIAGLMVCALSVSAGWSAAQDSVNTSQRLETMLIGDLADPNAPGLLETIRADSKEIALIKKDLDELRVESKNQHLLVLSAIAKIQRP